MTDRAVTLDLVAVTALIQAVLDDNLPKKGRPKPLLDILWESELVGLPVVVRLKDNTRWTLGTHEWKVSFRFIPLGEHEADAPLGGSIVHLGCKGHLLERKLVGNPSACLRDLTNMRVVLPAPDAEITTPQQIEFLLETP